MKRSDASLQKIDEALSHADRNYFVVGYGASRNMGGGGKHREAFHDSQRAQCIASLLDRQAPLNALEDWAIDLDYRKESAGLKIIRKVFDEFLPGIAFKKIDKKSRQLLLATPDGVVPLESLSDGYQNMASWMGDLLYRINDVFRDRKDPLKTRGVLLLDEIDLHLHPSWQQRLLKQISQIFPNMQLVATTHSPFTVQQAGPGELFTIQRENKRLLLDVFDGNPQELLLHQLIMSDVFGLTSDESVHVQKLKSDHEQLLNKKRKTLKDKAALKKIESQLKSIPQTSYSNSRLSEEDRKITLDVLKMYRQKRGQRAST